MAGRALTQIFIELLYRDAECRCNSLKNATTGLRMHALDIDIHRLRYSKPVRHLFGADAQMFTPRARQAAAIAVFQQQHLRGHGFFGAFEVAGNDGIAREKGCCLSFRDSKRGRRHGVVHHENLPTFGLPILTIAYPADGLTVVEHAIASKMGRAGGTFQLRDGHGVSGVSHHAMQRTARRADKYVRQSPGKRQSVASIAPHPFVAI